MISKLYIVLILDCELLEVCEFVDVCVLLLEIVV